MAVGILATEYKASGAASALFTLVLNPGQQYAIKASAAAWFKVTTGAGSAAADTSGNIRLEAGQTVLITGDATNNRVAVIQDTAAGDCLLMTVSDGWTP